jgi:hypothetical protein
VRSRDAQIGIEQIAATTSHEDTAKTESTKRMHRSVDARRRGIGMSTFAGPAFLERSLDRERLVGSVHALSNEGSEETTKRNASRERGRGLSVLPELFCTGREIEVARARRGLLREHRG